MPVTLETLGQIPPADFTHRGKIRGVLFDKDRTVVQDVDPKSPEAATAIKVQGATRGPSLIRPELPVLSLIQELKALGIPLGLVTNDFREGTLDALNRLGLSNTFQSVVTSGDAPKNKPEPEPFLLAAAQLGIQPEECAMVGDNLVSDVTGAKRVGMRTILKPTFAYDFEAGREIVGPDVLILSWQWLTTKHILGI